MASGLHDVVLSLHDVVCASLHDVVSSLHHVVEDTTWCLVYTTRGV